MRILLVGNYIPDGQQSMQRFGDLMYRELLAAGHEVTLLHPAIRIGPQKKAGLNKWLGYFDKFLLFPPALRRAAKQADVVHLCDQANAMYVQHLKGVPHVVTCHDVIATKSALGEVPENRLSSTGRKLQGMILDGLKAAQYVVSVSEVTQEEMLRVTGRPAGGSAVVYSSLNYPYQPMERDEALGMLDKLGFDGRKPFFLHMGGAIWYKNRLGVVGIFDRLRKALGGETQLLFVGGELEPELQAAVAAAGLAGRVHVLCGVSNEQLRAAYSLARALLFPSLQEGFGWPVLEAQACGCPVAASDRRPMTELGADAAVYFDPADLDAAATIVLDALPRAAEMRAAGLRNLERFTEEQMIAGYVAAYRHVVEQAHVQ